MITIEKERNMEELVLHLLEYMNKTKYIYTEDYYDEEVDKRVAKEKTKQFYSDLLKVFDDEYILKNIELFNINHLILSDRITEDIVNYYHDNLASDKVYDDTYMKFVKCIYHIKLSKEFINNLLQSKKFDCHKPYSDINKSLYRQENLIDMYFNDHNANIDTLNLLLYNDHLSDDQIIILIDKVRKTEELSKNFEKFSRSMSINKMKVIYNHLMNLVKDDHNE